MRDLLARALGPGVLTTLTMVPLPRLVSPGLLVVVDAYAMRGAGGRRLQRAPLQVPGLASLPEPFCHGLRCEEFIFASGQSALDERGESGSSPRGRGTRCPDRLGDRLLRFIPARAGNTRTPVRCSMRIPVHPRAGGEHRAADRPCTGSAGSSPRGRGTRHAGTVLRESVHPRAGGEHWAADREHGRLRIPARAGNTSRSRGPSARHRFIPARAGNTAAGLPRRGCIPVHPRAGGEHYERIGMRFIPARAGNTTMAAEPMTGCSSVHPRAGGEHIDGIAHLATVDGSSPRGRGTRGGHGAQRGAGADGSSPRGRGTLFLQPFDSANLF